MAALDETVTPKIIYDEGAAPSTPTSGTVITYAKTDGLMYSKDDAGTETSMGPPADIVDIPTAEMDDTLVLAPDGAGGVEFRAESGGGGTPQGTAFPGSPTTNDHFIRTNINNWEFFYDGTRWRTVQTFELAFAPDPGINTGTTNAADNVSRAGIPWKGTYNLWLLRMEYFAFVATTNDGSNNWTIKLNSAPPNDSGDTQIGSTVNTSADSPDNYLNKAITIGAATAGTEGILKLRVDKVSSPGAIKVNGTLYYQVIAT